MTLSAIMVLKKLININIFIINVQRGGGCLSLNVLSIN